MLLSLIALEIKSFCIFPFTRHMCFIVNLLVSYFYFLTECQIMKTEKPKSNSFIIRYHVIPIYVSCSSGYLICKPFEGRRKNKY